MPSFLQSTFLAGLLALAIPILIHLFFRLRTRRVELGTIRFLKLVLEENARRRKVMRWLLLALRLACVALLVGLFARPYFSHAGTRSDRPLHVVLIDRSATMGLSGDGRRPLEQAIVDVRALLNRWGDSVEAHIALFDDSVTPLPDDAAQLQHALDREMSRGQLFGGTSFGTALAWARDVLIAGEPGKKQLHLFTDLQRSGLDWTEGEPLPPGVEVHLHQCGRSIVNNVAVTEVLARKTWIRPGESTTVTATLANDGGFLLETVPVVLELEKIPNRSPSERGKSDPPAPAGRMTMRERVRLEAGASVPVEFSLPELSEGEWQGRVVVEVDDELAFDNARYFAISSAPPYRILIASGATERTEEVSESHFLAAALRLSPPGEVFTASPFSAEVVNLDEHTPLPALPPYAAVVLVNVADVDAADADRLAEFVRAGGGLVIFTGDLVTADSMRELARVNLACGGPGPVMVTRDLPWRIDRWDRRHELFAPFDDPQSGNLGRLIFAAYTRCTPGADDRVLAKFQNGDPVIVERSVGKGTVLAVTTSCGREWSDWATTRLFLPIVHQLLGYEVGLTAGGRVREQLIGVNSEKPASHNPPRGVSSNESAALPVPGVERQDRFLLVMNSNPKESETEPCRPADFEDRFALKFVSDDSGSEPDPAQLPAERKEEQWPFVACALLGVLLLEGFVGNRTTA